MADQKLSWRDRLPLGLFRFLMNLWPPFLGAGIKVKFIARDYSRVEVQLKMHWYNKNLVGTHFGGSIYAMTDAFYMLILLKKLGHDYIVWDKAAVIDFKKPGKGTLNAVFEFTPEEIAAIKQETDKLGKYVFDRPVDIHNHEGIVVASVIKTLYVRKKGAVT